MPTPSSFSGVVNQRSPSRSNEGVEAEARFTRDAALVSQDWRFALAMEGRAYVVNYGTPGSVITGATSITAAQPLINLDIPTNTSVIPVMFNITATAASGTVTNLLLRGATNLVGAGTSSGATVTPTNTNQNSGNTSACTARQAYSANGTAPTGVFDLFTYNMLAASASPSSAIWMPVVPMVLVGPASINGYTTATTTAPNIVAQLWYIELPSTAI